MSKLPPAGSMLLLLLVTDTSRVRERHWLLEGKSTSPLSMSPNEPRPRGALLPRWTSSMLCSPPQINLIRVVLSSPDKPRPWWVHMWNLCWVVDCYITDHNLMCEGVCVQEYMYMCMFLCVRACIRWLCICAYAYLFVCLCICVCMCACIYSYKYLSFFCVFLSVC